MKSMIVVKVDQCLGCKSCEMACAVRHSASQDLRQAIRETPSPRARVRVEQGAGFVVPLQCRQCEDAPCVEICPTAALRRADRDSPIVIDHDKQGFFVRILERRVDGVEVEADVVSAGTSEPLAGPWRIVVGSRSRRRNFSPKRWPRGEYWIRMRMICGGEPVGPYCIRAFMIEKGGFSLRRDPIRAGTSVIPAVDHVAMPLQRGHLPISKTSSRPTCIASASNASISSSARSNTTSSTWGCRGHRLRQ